MKPHLHLNFPVSQCQALNCHGLAPTRFLLQRSTRRHGSAAPPRIHLVGKKCISCELEKVLPFFAAKPTIFLESALFPSRIDVELLNKPTVEASPLQEIPISFQTGTAKVLSVVAVFPSPLGIGLPSESIPGRGGAPQIGEALPNTKGSSLEEDSSFGREAPLPERPRTETETTSCAEVSQVMKSRLHGKEAHET
nr:uncharacterized protein LOC129489408 isoform X2 [Symphalangus syndactylus]